MTTPAANTGPRRRERTQAGPRRWDLGGTSRNLRWKNQPKKRPVLRTGFHDSQIADAARDFSFARVAITSGIALTVLGIVYLLVG